MLTRNFSYIAMLAMLLAGPAMAQNATEQSFSDWAAQCEADAAFCAATTSSSGFVLRLSRYAGEPHWDLSIEAEAGFPAQPATLRILVDNAPIDIGKGGLVWADDSTGLFLVGDSSQDLFDRLVIGDRASVQTGPNASVPFSLAGLAASLLWIDESQDRVGSPRIVGTAPSERPGAGAGNPSQMATELPPELLDRHARQSSCDPLQNLVHGDDWEIHPLTEGHILYMVPCFSGAYNFSYQLYVGRAGSDDFERLLFVDYIDRFGWIGADQLVGAFFNPESLTLSSYYKGRGLGDCGTSGVWRWDEYGFRMVEFAAKSECDGTVDPGGFPQIWPN